MRTKRSLLASSTSAVAVAWFASASPTLAQDAPASGSAASPVGGQAAGSNQTPGSQAGVAAEQAGSAQGDQPSDVDEVVVTGSTSKRTLLDASVAITLVNRQQLEQKAPRSTADVLETIPGFFVEGTAGPVSNNYSVRGLPGGGSTFVRLIEDGMPLLYGGLNDDEVLQYDLSYDRVEAIQGGTSGVLTQNAAGASVNFISRKLNFDHAGGLARIQGTTYGDRRADLWYSAPLGQGFAFAISGYFDSTPGVRSSPFTYHTWRLKAQLQKQFDDGGFIGLTYKHWDEHDPYYADQPYSFQNGEIGGVPSLGTQFGNIIGAGFGRVVVPDSTAAGEPLRTFSLLEGVHPQGNIYRIDIDKPVSDSISLFGRARYTDTTFAFNGVFAGSGTGNGGLESAVNYLTYSPVSPIFGLLQLGTAAFPTIRQFGIKSLTDGTIIPASNAAALNALNGNGLLEQTVLNRQVVTQRDFGSDFGVRWATRGDNFRNSLTLGGMVYSFKQYNDQSGVATVVNDVRNNSNIYDVVALDANGGVVGTLSNNGLISYGNWGSGINNTRLDSQSIYVNDEFVFNEKLHFDAGLRYEHEHTTAHNGNSSPETIPAGIGGVVRTNPNAFNGTYSTSEGSENPVNWTVGANYVFDPSFSLYARYARSYQTQGVNPDPTGLTLYEAGVTFSKYGFLGTVRGFRTEFDNLSSGGGVVPDNPNLSQGFFADTHTNGVDVDAFYRPTFSGFSAFSLRAQLTYQKTEFANVRTGVININGQDISSQVDNFYNGKTPGRTPDWLFTITPQFDLPNGLGNVYARFKRVGRIFADDGDQLALPGYNVLTLGAAVSLRHDITLNISVDNVTNERGLTEGNPRQGFTQAVVNGYFYGRGIIGTNALGSISFAF
ncbi:TonB-dependent receptor domain-containing protein [uncultured Sphingomonas sp.]|uniref:TonB-dependent receptor domain-containing protein n=1 Tax=uncultured Sphingomonas sp. TaxID=158754 RepID=UPI0035CBA38F